MRMIEPLNVIFSIVVTDNGAKTSGPWHRASVALHQVKEEHREAFLNGMSVPHGARWIKRED
ncbi:hypothetical protein GCM10007160_18450 [Litchfieldella qijiaojingensis]|uniref:Uncharacterized protein n=1 Tax=Litchfieldella qijiaojingensis TaxID=980347 RepID=A0ABQ2YPN8_9GAMM|nr:hypothetical protein GCM10007160_18450 [Halomonas qijiaojingensis]